MGTNLNMKYSLCAILLPFGLMLSAILGGMVDWFSPLTYFLLHDAYCAILLGDVSRGATLLVAPHFPLYCCPHFLYTMKNSLFGYCHLSYTTYFITQKENFNKTSKGLLPFLEGRFPTKEIHGNSQEKAVENTPSERNWCHPILLSTCHHSPRLMLTGCSFLL